MTKDTTDNEGKAQMLVKMDESSGIPQNLNIADYPSYSNP